MKDAQAILQGVIKNVLATIHHELRPLFKIYLGQILVHSEKDDIRHSILLRHILERFKDHNVAVDVEGTVFMTKEVTYLGYVINENGRPIDLTRVLEFKQPENIKDLQSFLGFVGNHKDGIRNFDGLTEPLRRLIGSVSRGNEFYWHIEEQNAFNGLINALIYSEPIPLGPSIEQIFSLR